MAQRLSSPSLVLSFPACETGAATAQGRHNLGSTPNGLRAEDRLHCRSAQGAPALAGTAARESSPAITGQKAHGEFTATVKLPRNGLKAEAVQAPCKWGKRRNTHHLTHTVINPGSGGPGAPSGATAPQSEGRSRAAGSPRWGPAPPPPQQQPRPGLACPTHPAQVAHCPLTSLHLAGLHSHPGA